MTSARELVTVVIVVANYREFPVIQYPAQKPIFTLSPSP